MGQDSNYLIQLGQVYFIKDFKSIQLEKKNLKIYSLKDEI